MAERCAPDGNPEEIDADQNAGEKASGDKVNALQKRLQPSEELAAVDRLGPAAPGEMVSKIWEYIARTPAEPEDRREIVADDKLRRVFGKDKVTMSR